jgi:hypothetical protein
MAGTSTDRRQSYRFVQSTPNPALTLVHRRVRLCAARSGRFVCDDRGRISMLRGTCNHAGGRAPAIASWDGCTRLPRCWKFGAKGIAERWVRADGMRDAAGTKRCKDRADAGSGAIALPTSSRVSVHGAGNAGGPHRFRHGPLIPCVEDVGKITCRAEPRARSA